MDHHFLVSVCVLLIESQRKGLRNSTEGATLGVRRIEGVL